MTRPASTRAAKYVRRSWFFLALACTGAFAACSSDDTAQRDGNGDLDAAVGVDAAPDASDAAPQDAGAIVDASADASGITSNAFGDSFTQQWTDDFTKDSELNPLLWEHGDGIGPTLGPNGVDFSLLDSGTHKGYIGSMPTLFGRYEARIYNKPLDTDQAGYLVRMNATQLKWDGSVLDENPPYEDWNEIDLETYNGDYLAKGQLVPTYNLHFGDWTSQTLFNDDDAATSGIVAAGWHDWVIEWTPNYIAWYVDGAIRYVMHNRSWKSGWTPLSGASDKGRSGDGSGMEAQLYPMTWCFGSGTAGASSSSDEMYVSNATYSSLDMQTFAAQSYGAHSGGTPGVDSKGSAYVGGLAATDYLRYDAVDPRWQNLSIKVDASESGHQIQVRTGSPTGPILATIDVPVTHGPEWVYDDLVVQTNTSQVASAVRPFSREGTDVGKTLTVTSGTGFTPGTYTITAVTANIATLNGSVGTAGATAGHASLAWTDPTHYTLVSANLDDSSKPTAPRSLYLTFVGDTGGVNVHDLYFFGTAPSSNE